jgi:molybdopterin-biosynthesis enzyme MoeA-like protein
MSRGLGALQREIKTLLDRSFRMGLGPLRFADIRAVFLINDGGNPETDRLDPTHERSLKRALKTLVERGDVLIMSGKGGPGDPYRHVTVECFAAATGEVKDTAHAKQIFAKLAAEAAKAAAVLSKRHGADD